MLVDDFDFELPSERIALTPTPSRDGARMLHVGVDGALTDRMIKDLSTVLRAGDLVIVNNTKVLPAQLKGERAARPEGAPVAVDATLHKQISSTQWRAFARPAKRLREGDVISFGLGFNAVVVARNQGDVLLDFAASDGSFFEMLDRHGAMPLPPYIARQRPLEASDAERYQTIFAKEAGSVAAPTAGLHFTDAIKESLRGLGVEIAEVTLHVGAGTFLPVSVDDTTDHIMHAEFGEVPDDVAQQINKVKADGGRIIAVGTTSLRLLESAADEGGVIHPFSAETDIFITPGYRFKIVDCLLTNFHLPRSTLFMLVCAFSGTAEMKAAYAHAVAAQYRFYSYGDACFLERQQ